MPLPVSFDSPVPTPYLLLRRKNRRSGALEPPTLKRKRNTTAPDSFSFRPINDDLPFFDFPNFCTDLTSEAEKEDYSGCVTPIASPPPSPCFNLRPRTKRPSKFSLYPTELEINKDSKEQDQKQAQEEELAQKRRRVAPSTAASESAVADIKNAAPTMRRCKTFSAALCASSESCSTVTNESARMTATTTATMRRSGSGFQLNLSLMNLSGSNGSSSSGIPRRKSLFHIPSSTVTDGAGVNGNDRSSPVLDFFAKAMRFPG